MLVTVQSLTRARQCAEYDNDPVFTAAFQNVERELQEISGRIVRSQASRNSERRACTMEVRALISRFIPIWNRPHANVRRSLYGRKWLQSEALTQYSPSGYFRLHRFAGETP